MTKTEIMKLAEFDEKLHAEFAGYHSVDIPQLHETECPALFEYAKRIAQNENARLLPLIEVLAENNEKLVEALKFECGNRCAHQNPCNAKESLADHQARMDKLK